MKSVFLSKLIDILLTMLTPELLKTFADKILDFAEDYVIGTKSEIDDALILPLCSLIRLTFNIPDQTEI